MQICREIVLLRHCITLTHHTIQIRLDLSMRQSSRLALLAVLAFCLPHIPFSYGQSWLKLENINVSGIPRTCKHVSHSLREGLIVYTGYNPEDGPVNQDPVAISIRGYTLSNVTVMKTQGGVPPPRLSPLSIYSSKEEQLLTWGGHAPDNSRDFVGGGLLAFKMRARLWTSISTTLDDSTKSGETVAPAMDPNNGLTEGTSTKRCL